MRKIKGFTLIEMIIVMLITGIIAVSSAAMMLSAGFTNHFTGVKVTALSNQATLAMTR